MKTLARKSVRSVDHGGAMNTFSPFKEHKKYLGREDQIVKEPIDLEGFNNMMWEIVEHIGTEHEFHMLVEAGLFKDTRNKVYQWLKATNNNKLKHRIKILEEEVLEGCVGDIERLMGGNV